MKSPQPQITVDDTGFRVTRPRAGLFTRRPRSTAVAWTTIRNITAFKRDLFIVDCICIAVTTDEFILELNEEMAGWTEFIQALPTFLPGSRPSEQWWPDVAFPAFATNETVLFSRAPSTLRLMTDDK